MHPMRLSISDTSHPRTSNPDAGAWNSDALTWNAWNAGEGAWDPRSVPMGRALGIVLTLRELPTPVIGAPARRVVPKCKGSSEAVASWSRSFRGRKVGRGRREASHVQKRRLSRNGGDGSIEDDEAENICLNSDSPREIDFCVRVCQRAVKWRSGDYCTTGLRLGIVGDAE